MFQIHSCPPPPRPSIIAHVSRRRHHYHGHLRLSMPISNCASNYKPKPKTARDRVMEFGKHKGKMMGTLPSSYLKWVSRNLRASNTEEWAKMADEVLRDPVYRDRIEWEFAEALLSGDHSKRSSSSSNEQISAAEELVEMSERFGWDYEDRVGWSRVDWGLLGTSKGGRIPRKKLKSSTASASDVYYADDAYNNVKQKEEEEAGEAARWSSSRTRRRDRVRSKTKRTRRMSGVADANETDERNGRTLDKEEGEERMVRNPFPGRQSLLNKLLAIKSNNYNS